MGANDGNGGVIHIEAIIGDWLVKGALCSFVG